MNSILNEYEKFSQVKAIAIGGSSTAKTSDLISDIDVYIFVSEDIPVKERENLVKKYSSNYEVGGEYFGSGDEYFVDSLNQQLDVMFWNVDWFENVVDNVWVKNYPSNGYTTAFLYTLNNFKVEYDPQNWLLNLQNKIKTDYPQKLKENIIKRNIMLIKDKPFASYYEQVEKALKRNDLVSVNHRISAFLASYFDIIFAINELLHPGEKRLIKYAKDNCKKLPKSFEENIEKLINQPNEDTLMILEDMVKNIKELL
ncbi:DUF4037 domain-containing protein [bacterium]|nr:DUF4037 domain-containing protein [bacterium]